MTKNILVTGGCGNIGTFVVRHLVEHLDCHPVTYDLRGGGAFLRDIAGKITTIDGDVLDMERLKSVMREQRIEGVIHMAKLLDSSGIPQSDPRRALMVNVLGTANVLEAARSAGIRRVVFSSSKAVYGEVTGKHGPPDYVPITEDYPKFDREDPAFIPFYSVTNKMAEYYGIRYAMRFDMEFVVLRFAEVWGPGKAQTRAKNDRGQLLVPALGALLCSVIEGALAGERVTIDSGADERQDMVYLKDVAMGVAKACLSDKIRFDGNHRDIHLGSGTLASLGEAVGALKRQIPGADISIGPGRLPDAGRRRMQALFDISRAAEELGFVPRYRDLNDAIADYIEMKRKFA